MIKRIKKKEMVQERIIKLIKMITRITKKEMVQERAGLPLVEEYGLDVNPGSLTRFQIILKVKVVPDHPHSDNDLNYSESESGFRSPSK